MRPKSESTYPRLQSTPVKLLSRLFCGESPENSGDSKKAKKVPSQPGFWFFLFGVLVPSFAILFESCTHFCARHFFDPLPSTFHVLLVSLIPLCNLLLWLAPRANLSAYYAPITLLAGMAMGIAVMYSIMFLPLASVSLMWTLALIGFFGLSPMLSMGCLWKGEGLIAHLVEQFGTFFEPHQVKHVGHLVVLITVLVIEFPSTVTRIYMQTAAKPETAAEGIQKLRQFGNKEVMLRACYERSGRATDILGSICEIGHPLKVQQARDIYYKVTGKPFNSIPIPKSLRATIQHAGNGNEFGELNRGVKDEFDLDTDIAGEVVSGFARGLAVNESAISGIVEPDAAIAELNWTFGFKNDSQYDREARAKVLLPAGAVVTRATVWVAGQEREAEIQVRSQARASYRKAVLQKSGPLLVSVCGPDSVLVQCYPVVPGAGLKVRLGIVAPLGFDGANHGVLALPSFEERNFQIDAEHHLSLVSPRPLKIGSSVAGSTSAADNQVALNAKLKNADLSTSEALVHVDRDGNFSKAATADKFSSNASGNVLEQQVESLPQAPKQLAVVVDGSIGMAPAIEQVREALRELPESMDTSLVFVTDVPQILCERGTHSKDVSYQNGLNKLTKASCEGGQNNFPELCRQIRDLKACQTEDASVLWIHAAQPQDSPEELRALHRCLNTSSRQTPVIYDLQVVSGPNQGLDGVTAGTSVERVHRIGSVADDLRNLLAGWSGKSRTVSMQIQRNVSAEQFESCNPAPKSLAQLWAYQEISRRLNLSEPVDQQEALALASTYHLVSPVSSAIALEPKEGWKVNRREPKNMTSWLKSPFFRKSSSRSGELSGAREGAVFNKLQAPVTGIMSGLDEQKALMNPLAESKKEQAPILQGATNGTIGPQADDATVVQGINTAGTVTPSDSANQVEEVPETSTVPESDTWLLVGAVLLFFGVLSMRSRLRVRKA